jgi:hypothetical protein
MTNDKKVMQLTEAQKNELCLKYGERFKGLLADITKVFADLIKADDPLGVCYLTECVAALTTQAGRYFGADKLADEDMEPKGPEWN